MGAGHSNTYFCASLTNNWSTTHSKNKVGGKFAVVFDDMNLIRFKKSFKWGGTQGQKIVNLNEYNGKVHSFLHYIHDEPNKVYIKRCDRDGAINLNSIVISFCILHRLSELCRYHPESLMRHYKNKYSWILEEFLKRVLDQVVDEISAEITGREIC
ncbi:MAG: YaaC family protein [Pseudomonadota bacterium]|nr:YaaC family protein [Pseudomonadota bacterium]